MGRDDVLDTVSFIFVDLIARLLISRLVQTKRIENNDQEVKKSQKEERDILQKIVGTPEQHNEVVDQED